MYRVSSAASVHGPMGKMTDWQEVDCADFTAALCKAFDLIAEDKQTVIIADTDADNKTARIECRCINDGLRYDLIIRIENI